MKISQSIKFDANRYFLWKSNDLHAFWSMSWESLILFHFRVTTSLWLFLCKILVCSRTIKQINIWNVNQLWMWLSTCTCLCHRVCLQISVGERCNFCPCSTKPVFKWCSEVQIPTFQTWNLHLTGHVWMWLPDLHVCMYKPRLS